MNISKAFVFLLLLALPTIANSQVTDLPAGRYGGEFRDDSTGKVWLKINALGTISYEQRQAILASSPFRFATRADLQPLLSVNILSQDAVGPYF